MLNSKIMAAGSSLGRIEVSTRSLLDEARFERIGLSNDLVEKELGITHVRHCSESVKPGDLAIEAGHNALKKSGVPAGLIDAVFFCGIERDYSEPATAHRVAHELGINAPFCWDKSDACHGFTAGLIEADLLIRSGRVRYALVCTGERSSNKTMHVGNLFAKGRLKMPDVRDTLGAFTLGDGGGAMIMGPSDDGSGVQAVHTRCQSKYSRLCFWDEWGLEPTFAMKMGKICATTINLVKRMIPETLDKLAWSREDIDLMIPHQVGAKPFYKYLDMFNIEVDKSIATYERLGNLASATIPICYDILENQGRFIPGQRTFIVSSGSGIVVSQLGIIH